MNTINTILRDGGCVSPWQLITEKPGIADEPNQPTVYDCLVIGAGITGLTAALLLQSQGKRTVIAEAHTVGFGTTGGTSAHINTFADASYKDVESDFGEKNAELFARAIGESIELIKENIRSYQVECDFEEKPGYVYAESEEQAKELDDIYQASLRAGVNVSHSQHAPTPVPHQRALQFGGQAQFHPLKYLQGLQKAYLAAGGIILEHTLIEKLTSENDMHIAMPANIRARNVIYATHMPPNINVFNFKCAPYRSYVIAVKLEGANYPDALIYDMQEPYHYVRTHVIDGQPLLLIGGNDHKTGHEVRENSFHELEKYARKYYDISSIDYKWSSQYYVPVDGLPYVGQLPLADKGIYCATGYNGNGMMLGSISGKILSDMVLGRENIYADLFSPSRIKPVAGFTEFVAENADVAYHFVADRLAIASADTFSQIAPDSGEVLEIDGKKIAAYRDKDGVVHALSPVCTHAGCIVSWNNAEKTWDCPCHGARYDIDGTVLTGPATKKLQAVALEGKRGNG